MKAQQLFTLQPDGIYKEAGVYFCTICQDIWLDEERAERCCRCRECGELLPSKKYRQRGMHEQCRDASEARWLADKAAKAVTVPDDGGMVYDEESARYYNSLEDFLEAMEDREEDQRKVPAFVYPTTRYNFPGLPAVGVLLESELEDFLPEDADESYMSGIDELQLAITAFNEANKTTGTYCPDFTKKIAVEVR